MSTCEPSRRLSAYHDGEVDEAERAVLEAHLARCPACAAELARLRRLSRLVSTAGRPEAPPEVVARLRRAADEVTLVDAGRVAKAFLTAAAAILVGSGLWLWQSEAAEGPAEPIPLWETVAAPQQTLVAGSDEQLAEWIVQDLERTNGHD